MESWFIYGGIAMCVFALWSIGRRDWARLTGSNREVDATVLSHRISRDNDGTSYGAVYRFSAEGKDHEVTDEVLQPSPQPPVGARVKLTYPYGRPDLARVPRRAMWITVYGLLLFLIGILIAKALGMLPD
ncbi:MAG: DUF3592 domain-containing protein [Novosphingobium sp.]